MSVNSSARALVDQMEAEAESLLAGDYGALLEGLDEKRTIIEKTSTGFPNREERLAVRSAARRQQRLLRAALAGINAARTHLLNASKPANVTSYSANGTMHTCSPGSGTTLKRV
jgi:hypothetical protein